MRILTLGLFLIVATAPVAAIAEPPPAQAAAVASAPAITVADVQHNALVVTQADTSSTIAVERAAARDEGRGKLFWAIGAFVLLVGGVFLYRYLTREPEPYQASERSAPPDPAERRPKSR